MKTLEKILERFKDYLKDAEKKHETDIFSFINLDEDIMNDFLGDWTEEEVRNYNYIFERAATLEKAKKIIEEELLAEKIANHNK